MKRATVILAFVTHLVAVPSALGQKEGITVIKQVRQCRVALKGDDTNQQPQLSRFQDGLEIEYQVLVKSADTGKLETLATLKKDSSSILGELPYAVTAGTILKARGSLRRDCSSLLGMTAIPVTTGAELITEDIRRGAVTSSEEIAASPAAVASEPLPVPSTPEPSVAPAPAQFTVPEQAPVLASDNLHAQWSPPLVAIDAGPHAAQLRTAGLKIDSNDSQSLALIGPKTHVTFYPAMLVGRLSRRGMAAEWLFPLHLSYSASMLSAVKPINIERNGVASGSQESSLRAQSIRIGYDFNYFQNQIRTSVYATPWSNVRLRSNLRSFSDPLPNTLRDLEISCLALGLTQSFQFAGGIDLALTFAGCLQNESRTPINTRAEFPNQSSKFSRTKQLSTGLKIQIPLAVPDKMKQSNDYPLYLVMDLGAQRWQGSLELDDKQVIDAEATNLSAALGFGLALR